MFQARRVLVLASVLFIAGCGNEASGSKSVQAPATAVSQAVAEAAPAPKSRAIDMKATQLERVDFQGLPPVEVLDAVMRLNPMKDKYESDVEHAKRMKEAASAPLLEDIKVGDLVGFSPSEVRFHYDANRQEWQYEVWPSELGTDFANVQVYSESLPAAQFPQYANVYRGRDLEFKKSIHLHLANLKGLSYIIGAVKVPRAEARELEDLLTVLLVGRLVPVHVTTDQKLPLKYDEREVNFQTALSFKLEGVWLVNKRTGQVLSKAWKVRRDA